MGVDMRVAALRPYAVLLYVGQFVQGRSRPGSYRPSHGVNDRTRQTVIEGGRRSGWTTTSRAGRRYHSGRPPHLGRGARTEGRRMILACWVAIDAAAELGQALRARPRDLLGVVRPGERPGSEGVSRR